MEKTFCPFVFLPERTRGFTLVELAIVLVIIGLIVGGVMVGQDLITQSELKSVLKDKEYYQAATSTFRLKYNCLPGDCPNAYDFFGSTCDATPANCNGDNDGIIADAGASPDRESLRYWQHLSLASLVNGNYTGLGNATATGTSVPKVSLRNGGVNIYGYAEGASVLPTHLSGKQLYVIGSASATHMNFPLFKTQEAFSLDTKTDDGSPDKGMVITYTSGWMAGSNPNCKTGSNPNSTYNLSYTGTACHLNFAW